MVKQIETLGKETISGIVCSLAAPFVVHAATAQVAWNFVFDPQDKDHGRVTYSYSIPAAGESHDARGNYSVAPPGNDGTRRLSMKVSDHVVFKGFDGNIPVSYRFDLVPVASPGCPATP